MLQDCYNRVNIQWTSPRLQCYHCHPDRRQRVRSRMRCRSRRARPERSRGDPWQLNGVWFSAEASGRLPMHFTSRAWSL